MKCFTFKRNVTNCLVLIVGVSVGWAMNDIFNKDTEVGSRNHVHESPLARNSMLFDDEVVPSNPVVEDSLSGLVDSIALYRSYSADEFESAYKDFKHLSREERAIMLPAFFTAWGERDPETALLEAKSMSRQKDEAVAVVLRVWLNNDPAAASKFYKLNEQGLFTRNYLKPWNQVSGAALIAKEIAKDDPVGAIAWVSQLNDLADKNYSMGVLFETVGSRNPNIAIQLLSDLPDGLKEIGMESLASVWVKQDLNATIDWVNTLDERVKPQVIPKLIEGIAKQDPSLAAEYLEFVDGNRDAEIDSIVRPWLEVNPEEAADWFASSTTPDEQAGYMHVLLGRWLDKDFNQAKEWVMGREPGVVKDIALESYVATAASGHENHLTLIELARQGIEDQTLRERAVTTALVQWSQIDSDKAQAFAENSAALSNDALADYYFQINAEVPLD